MHRYRGLLALGLWLLGWGCSSDPGAASFDPSVTLRFKPDNSARWREHWIYDLDAPGMGAVRTALSSDVTVVRPEPNTPQLHYLVRRQFHGRAGTPEPLLELSGTQVRAAFEPDRSLFGDFSVDARSSAAADLVRELVLAIRFGMLLEYPDQAITVGDSWSIEPRTLSVGPGLPAILRPSYALESIGSTKRAAIEATIGADIQVDLIPQVLGDGVLMEGGGTASGTLRVRASDGVLLDARTILHFNQEVRVLGSETLGYREFSIDARIFTTAMTAAAPDLAADAPAIEPLDPEETRACAGSLDVVATRVGRATSSWRAFVLGALSLESLPSATAAAATVLREPGALLWFSADGKRVELDGSVLEGKELQRALRSRGVREPLYVFAAASVPLERVRSVLAPLPRAADVRRLVRVVSGAGVLPRASRFVEEQLRAALTQSAAERQTHLQQLLVEHLVLCDGALDVYRKLERTKQGAADAPSQILRELERCGCTTTQVEGLELTLQALFGPTELRAVRGSVR